MNESAHSLKISPSSPCSVAAVNMQQEGTPGGIGMDLSFKPYRISLRGDCNLAKILFFTVVLLNFLILVSSSNITYTGFNYSISRPKSPPLEVYRSAKSEFLIKMIKILFYLHTSITYFFIASMLLLKRLFRMISNFLHIQNEKPIIHAICYWNCHKDYDI